MKTTTKTNLAKFGIFEISEEGADCLYRCRNTKGQPFQDRVQAKNYLDDHIKPFIEYKGRNFSIKHLNKYDYER